MSLGEEGSSPSTDRLMPKTCESVVTNERQVVRLIKMVRPKWKRADLIIQVCFWVLGALNSVFVGQKKTLYKYHIRKLRLACKYCICKQRSKAEIGKREIIGDNRTISVSTTHKNKYETCFVYI